MNELNIEFKYLKDSTLEIVICSYLSLCLRSSFFNFIFYCFLFLFILSSCLIPQQYIHRVFNLTSTCTFSIILFTLVSISYPCHYIKQEKFKLRESKLLYFLEGIPTALQIFLSFETKRNIDKSSTKTST